MEEESWEGQVFQGGINCSVDACAGFALEPSMAQAKHGSEPRTTADAWLSWSLDQVHHHPILYSSHTKKFHMGKQD